jgi:hypothetical protein
VFLAAWLVVAAIDAILMLKPFAPMPQSSFTYLAFVAFWVGASFRLIVDLRKEQAVG